MTTRTSTIELPASPDRPLTLLTAVGVLAAYIVFGLIGLQLAVVDGVVSPLWPASGLAIAALVRWGLRWWPCILLGAAVVNATTAVEPLGMAAIAIGNTLEAVVAAVLLRAADVSRRLSRPRDVLWFAMLAGCSATLISAGIGVSTLVALGDIPRSGYANALLTWWTGDALGTLLLGPVVLLLPFSRRQLPTVRTTEQLACAGTIAAVAVLAFAFDPIHGRVSPLAYVLWPLLLWPALRMGIFATAAATAVVAVVAVVLAGPAGGTDGHGQLNHDLLSLQGYLASTVIATLVLAATMVGYRRATADLRLTQHAVDAAGDAVLWTDAEGRIAYANPALARLMQRPVELLIGTDFIDCVANFVHDDWRELLAVAGSTGRAVSQVDLLPYRGGTTPIELAASRLVHEGAPYVCLILRDLSEREQLENHLIQAQKMDAIGRLAGGIAHDFNNMLAAMYGNAELLQMQQEAKGQDLRHVTNIILTCERARELTNQLMVFSRNDHEEIQVIDLAQAVQEAVDLNRRMISESIAIEHRPAPGTGLSVRANPSRIQQLVMNLLLNARDAMPGGGRITVTTDSVEITTADCVQMPQASPGKHHRLRIEDTGGGIPEEALTRIFEPFFTTKETGRGTGLGLAIVHGIVQRAGGFVTVASSRGRGARFDVYLPVAEGPREETTSGRLATTAIARIGLGKRALLVEDDPQVLEMVRDLLERASFSVEVATNGKAGLRAVDENPTGFDLIVTDLVMPDLGGVDMATGIRERSGTLPVLFMSGYGEDEASDAGERQALHTAFLGKPFTIQDFALTVRALLNPRPKL